jgi:DtxR family transcriptional regulator, Mn-dependent transcriptional regulator
MPSSTVENYLKAIYTEAQVTHDGLVPMGRLASAMGVVPGTATSMVKTLADSGLVSYEPREGVRLTGGGRQLALHVLRRHRLVELFLVQTLGLDWSEVHEEAEELEHAISDKVLDRIDALLGHPAVDPHGDPIPTARGTVAEPSQTSLADAEPGMKLRITRVTDQDPAFLQFINRCGLLPGTSATVLTREPAAGAVAVRTAGGNTISLGLSAAAKLMVDLATDRDPPSSAHVEHEEHPGLLVD